MTPAKIATLAAFGETETLEFKEPTGTRRNAGVGSAIEVYRGLLRSDDDPSNFTEAATIQFPMMRHASKID